MTKISYLILADSLALRMAEVKSDRIFRQRLTGPLDQAQSKPVHFSLALMYMASRVLRCVFSSCCLGCFGARLKFLGMTMASIGQGGTADEQDIKD